MMSRSLCVATIAVALMAILSVYGQLANLHNVPGHIGLVPSIGPILSWQQPPGDGPNDNAPIGLITHDGGVDGGVAVAAPATCDCPCVNRCLNTPFSQRSTCWKACPASNTQACEKQCFQCPCGCVNDCLNAPFNYQLQCWRDHCPAGDTQACKTQCFKCPCDCVNKCMNMPFGQEMQCWRDTCPQGDCDKCKKECFKCDCPCVNRCEVVPFSQETACWKNCTGSHTTACQQQCKRPNCGEGSICDLCAAVCMETGAHTPEHLAQCFKDCNGKYKCNNWCGHT